MLGTTMATRRPRKMKDVLIDFIERCADEQADPAKVREMLLAAPEAAQEYYAECRRLMEVGIQTFGGPVYNAPILAPSVCDKIVAAVADYPFSPNMSEEAEYRINEVVMRHVDPAGYEVLESLLMPTLNAYCLMLYSKPISRISSLQFAKYNVEGTRETKFHHDVESDFTCVISLNPEAFTGGGTGIRLSPDLEYNVPPLPKGYGLIFNGKAVHHRGLPVDSGERVLLVCWYSTAQ